jgi:hypothetical protein
MKILYYMLVSPRPSTIFCGAGWQPAADWQSACPCHPIRYPDESCRLRPAAMWGSQSWLQPSFRRLFDPAQEQGGMA